MLKLNTKKCGTGMRWQQSAIACAFTAILSAHAPAWAHSANDSGTESLQTKVRAASLVAFGQVVDIQYRNSSPTRGQPKGVPHTFVTYQIQEVLRGETPSKTLTLRIPGGADGQGDAYLDTSAPAFAFGQTDVLFVKGGAINGCQLVDCVEGRFRVVDNLVYNGWGVPVIEAEKQLRIGGKPRFDLNVMDMPSPTFDSLLQRADVKRQIELMSKQTGLTLEDLRKKYELEAPKFTKMRLGYQALPLGREVLGVPPAKPSQTFGAPLTMDLFFNAVRNWSKLLGAPTTKVVLADAKLPFTVPDPRALAFKATEAPPKISEEERLDDKVLEGVK